MKKHFTVTYDISKLSDDEQKSLFAEAQSLFQSGKAVSAGWDDGWISVKDRLPKSGEVVLVCLGKAVLPFVHPNKIFTGLYDPKIVKNNTGWYVYGWSENPFVVTHWQSLPAPPKELPDD